MGLIDIDLADVDLQTIEPLPAGKYTAIAIDGEIKDKNGRPYGIQWTFEVAGTKRRVWDYMVLNHPVGQKRLLQFALAVNHPTPRKIKNTESFLNIPFTATLSIEEDENNKYPPKNKIYIFEKLVDKADSPATQAQNDLDVMPWDK